MINMKKSLLNNTKYYCLVPRPKEMRYAKNPGSLAAQIKPQHYMISSLSFQKYFHRAISANKMPKSQASI